MMDETDELDGLLRALGNPAGAEPQTSAAAILARAAPPVVAPVAKAGWGSAALFAAGLTLGVGAGAGGVAAWVAARHETEAAAVAEHVAIEAPAAPEPVVTGAPVAVAPVASAVDEGGAAEPVPSADPAASVVSMARSEARSTGVHRPPSTEAAEPSANDLLVATPEPESRPDEPSVAELAAEIPTPADEAAEGPEAGVALLEPDEADPGPAEDRAALVAERGDRRDRGAGERAVAHGGVTRHRVGAGVGGAGVVSWGSAGPAPVGGPSAGVAWTDRTGAISGFSPVIGAEAQLDLLPGEAGLRPAGTVAGGAGLSWELGRMRVDATWTLAGLLHAQAPDRGGPRDDGPLPPEAGGALLTGPEIAASYGEAHGPRLRAALAARTALPAFGAPDAVFIGLQLGVDAPVGRRFD